MNYAQKTAHALERSRVRTLGADATLEFFDASGDSLASVEKSFTVTQRTNVALGEEYTEIEVAEVGHGETEAQLTQDHALTATTARLSTSSSVFKVGIIEDPKTAARTWLVRLTALSQDES